MIRVVHSGSQIGILTLSIPDPEVKKASDPQYYAKPIYYFYGTDAWGPEKFENSGSGSLSLHTNSEEPSLRRLNCTEVKTGQRR
jgi:hypothetical protein